MAKIQQKFGKICELLEKTAKNSANFNENFEIRERCPVFDYGFQKRCKGVHCVDLNDSFPTTIYLQNFASIQPRTSPGKFAPSPFVESNRRVYGSYRAKVAARRSRLWRPLPRGGPKTRTALLRRSCLRGRISASRGEHRAWAQNKEYE